MQSDKSGKQQQETMIIVMKGPMENKKHEIACQLAEFLHYLLIDERDIIEELDNPHSRYSTFVKILTKIIKTQLQLKLQVILNTSLSHNKPLLDLAMSKGAQLLIIECKDGGDQTHDFYQDECAWIACIDITKPFNVEEFSQKILDGPKDNEKPASGGDKKPTRGGDKIIPQRILREAHAHEFFFTEEPKMKTGSSSSSSKLQYCNCCEEVVSGPTYQCIVCDEFIFHESCAELPIKKTILKKGGRFYLELNPNPNKYEFSQTNKCRSCETYSLDCNNCLLQTHIKCGLLPTIWRYKEHDKHPLSFVIVPFWCKYQYQCIACSKYGMYMGYKCYGCNINLHVSCALKEAIVTGPWGGDMGDEWDDGGHSAVKRLWIVYGQSIDLIQIEYVDKGKPFFSKKHGYAVQGYGRREVEVMLDYPNEYLTEVHGTYGYYYNCVIVLSLTLQSNKNTYGPFGNATKGKYFSSLRGTDGGHYKIVGFHGKSLGYLYSIGFYLESIDNMEETQIIIT